MLLWSVWRSGREREKVGKIGDFYTHRSDQEGGSRDIFREADLGGNGLYDTLFLGCTQCRLKPFVRPSIDSDLSALQPYFGSYGYGSVAIFRMHAADRQAIMLTL